MPTTTAEIQSLDATTFLAPPCGCEDADEDGYVFEDCLEKSCGERLDCDDTDPMIHLYADEDGGTGHLTLTSWTLMEWATQRSRNATQSGMSFKLVVASRRLSPE